MRANAGALATILGLFKDRIHHPVVLSVLQNCDLRVGDILFSSAEDLSSKPSCVGVPTWDCRGFSCVCLSCRQSSVCAFFSAVMSRHTSAASFSFFLYLLIK